MIVVTKNGVRFYRKAGFEGPVNVEVSKDKVSEGPNGNMFVELDMADLKEFMIPYFLKVFGEKFTRLVSEIRAETHK